jgi:hypothetical protein
MNIWIVTTGSSDVKLKTDYNWHTFLFKNVRNQLYSRKFAPTRPPNTDDDEPFIVPARAMGMVYGSQLTDEYYQDLHFPLLDAFSAKLLEKSETNPDRIIVILTDQDAVFDEPDRKIDKSPYWQDTCTLKPILEQYFEKKFPKFKSIDYLELKPKSKDEGLDNWNKALVLVQKAFSTLDFDKNATVYVSHQAGTPAISSAVQFASLARFRTNVEFLVSNEYEKKPLEPIKSSEYLKGIKFQEAKALLDRHDYSGVKELLAPYLTPETKILLNAAIQWNFAKFDEFINLLESDPKFAEELQERKLPVNWWWMAYESAYLAIVRLQQGNTVEAMFHNFRAVEGLLIKWVDRSNNIEHLGKKITKEGKKIRLSHEIVAPWDNTKTRNKVNAYGQGLYYALKFLKGVDENKDTEFDIWKFGNYVFNIRNSLFHNLEGLKDKEAVFKAWEISIDDEQEGKEKMEQKWKNRVLGCLNFISEQSFTSPLEEASLMFKVHKELEKAIARQ